MNPQTIRAHWREEVSELSEVSCARVKHRDPAKSWIQILNPKLEPRLLTCKCIGFVHLFKHDHTIKCTYKSVFFVLCLFASSFELFFNCFHVRHFITWQFTCKICQKLYTNYRLKGKNMSNVNEIMMFYRAWQYHKIEINIKKKRHLAMQHIQISVFTAVSSHPIFFWDMSNMKTESKQKG